MPLKKSGTSHHARVLFLFLLVSMMQQYHGQLFEFLCLCLCLYVWHYVSLCASVRLCVARCVFASVCACGTGFADPNSHNKTTCQICRQHTWPVLKPGAQCLRGDCSPSPDGCTPWPGSSGPHDLPELLWHHLAGAGRVPRVCMRLFPSFLKVKHSLAQSRPFDLLLSVTWSILSHGPKRLTCYFPQIAESYRGSNF